VLGDLTIQLVGTTCGYEINGAGQLTLAPTLQAGWTGPGYFPGGPAGVQFTMTTNYGESRPGTLTSTTPAAYPIDGQYAPGNRWLGHTVMITVTIDPDNAVAESNESNNTTMVYADVPNDLPLPVSGLPPTLTVPCHG
jgi:hypothetical protein